MMEGRNIPGFSADSIRLDQARSTRRAAAPLGQARLNKLKLVQDAKVAWRKEKAAKLEAHKQSIEDGDDEDMLDGPAESDQPGLVKAPEVIEVDFAADSATAVSHSQDPIANPSLEVPRKMAMPLESAPVGIVA